MSKRDLRHHLRAIRHQILEEEFRLECQKILMKSTCVPELMNAKTVLSYWPKLEAHEIDLRPLNCWLRATGCTVLLPITEPKSQILRIQWGMFQDEKSLTLNQWGIAEPPKSPEILAEDIDVIITPGLGFDSLGYRIGYGGGFYDQLFEHVKAYKIGLIMDSCLFETIPSESHDVPVDLVISANQIIEINSP
ncbi:MAG: 5-formyltetrahydrofolate cyclo-ligase [Bacteroidetes bacterium]|nr:5-formyltetrahydrofolate cyclo-ligase [Bacteroidota bacterium]MCY4234556.1 5-formyltetrahydrofolate cyclo-ligase [Bacteroidota bacterium]